MRFGFIEINMSDALSDEDDIEEAILVSLPEGDGEPPEGLSDVVELIPKGDLTFGFNALYDVRIEVINRRNLIGHGSWAGTISIDW